LGKTESTRRPINAYLSGWAIAFTALVGTLKLVEPGVTKTAFGGRSMEVLDFSSVPDYAPLMKRIDAARARFTRNAATPELVAATIFDAANDRSDRLRYLAGADARRLWLLRRWFGHRTQAHLVRKLFKL
jgi:hypothetical protein